MTLPHLLRLPLRLRFRAPGPLLRHAATALALLLALPLGSGCSSGGTRLQGRDLTNFPGGQVSFISRGTSLTLIGDARLKRIGIPGQSPSERYQNFYSTVRDGSAVIKIVDDQVIAGLLEGFEDFGLKKEASLRDVGGLDMGAALAVVEGSTSYVLERPNPATADPKLIESFDEFSKGFYQIFNSVEGFQSLGNQSIDFRTRHNEAIQTK